MTDDKIYSHSDAQQTLGFVARKIREMAIAEVLDVLERGCDIGQSMQPLPNGHLCERIRRERKRLVERDLYEFHYGELSHEQCGGPAIA